MGKINLPVGPITLRLNFGNDELNKQFSEYFLNQSSSDKPDIELDIKVTDRGRFKNVPNSLFLTKKRRGKGFVSGEGLIKGVPSNNSRKWNITVHRLLITGDFRRVFEQILYQAYYTASIGLDTVQVHSSAVIKNGKGYLFVGPSESGKSTVANLSRSFQVTNDEINIIDLRSPVPRLCSTPFNGLFREKSSGSAPLKGVFILNQAPFHNIEKISGGNAVRPLAGEIIPLVGLEDQLDSDTYAEMLDKAIELAGLTEIYRMDFLPDSGFWKLLEEIE